MVIILMGLIVFAAILIVGYPLVNSQRYEYVENGLNGDENFEHLASARNSVFEAIRDLEFDRATDKLSDADYQHMRARYDVKAAEVLQKMDALGAAKAKRAAAAPEAAGGERSEKARTPKAGTEKSFCSRCGTPVQAADRFCPKCGTHLK
jgi:rubrerythrin